MTTLFELLIKALDDGASDLHLIPGLSPLYRINTVLAPANEWAPLTPEQTGTFVKEMLGEERFKQFLLRRDMDFSMQVRPAGRFRVNAHFQRNVIAIAFRAIPPKPPELSDLGLPPIIQSFAELPRGLVVVTGQTGHGKSTTLAAMIHHINQRFSRHVITLEDPIEYELLSSKSVIEQRELGSDLPTFASGLKHALRQDPDMIMVGEMRDLETTAAAITAAETGHLVLSSMHTMNSAQTVERILDLYPAEQQNQIRGMLANTLQAVVSLMLFKRIDIEGMTPACEIMICNAAVRNCIRTNRIHEIPNIIQTTASAGMCTLDDSIRALCESGMIGRDQALAQAVSPQRMDSTLGGQDLRLDPVPAGV